MENTGRIRGQILPIIQRMLFEKDSDLFVQELRIMSEIDRAHLIMLAECGIVPRPRVARLLCAIEKLRVSEFAPLLEKRPTRGTYLLYEDYLIQTEGSSVGGVLQTGRSRNDLNATIHKIRLRTFWKTLLREGLRLQAVLLRRSKKFSAVVMPAYTHGQAATPSTFGHYLTGIAHAMGRHLRSIANLGDEIDCCPLGAGAATGSTLPIDPSRTAHLLGFKRSNLNSLDAVASRDLALRLVAEAAILGITLSRLAADLFAWCTKEFAFITLPDDVVGSSSAMPQKRNPFLLEHVQGLAGSALGGFVSAAGAMHSTPFTNSIAVGTEALRGVWGALQGVADALILCRMVIARAEPNALAMLDCAENSAITSTALASRIAYETDRDFRSAHHIIGDFIRTKEPSGFGDDENLSRFLQSVGIEVSLDKLDPSSVVAGSRWGGGPAAPCIDLSIKKLTEEWQGLKNLMRVTSIGWLHACQTLEKEAKNMQQCFESRDAK